MVQITPLHFIRDYETVGVEQEVPSEFLLLFDDETQPPTANYKNTERKIVLKKKHVNVSQGPPSPFIVVLVSGVSFPALGITQQVGHPQCRARWNESRGDCGGTG